MSANAAVSKPSRHLNPATCFCEQAEREPDRTALWVRGEFYSYGELHARASQIAGWLASSGIGPGSRVGVLGGRSIWSYAALLASSWSGATCVPLNPDVPEQRLIQLMESAEVHALVFDETGQEKLTGSVANVAPAARLALVESEGGEPGGGPPALRSVEALAQPAPMAPDDVAYLMFTSGTTGAPKGVMVSAGGWSHLLGVLRERYVLRPDDRVSQFFEFDFDLSTFDMYMTWAAGATLFSVPYSARMAPGKFIREHALTLWFSVPSTAAFMLRVKSLAPGAFPSLRMTLFCGEPLLSEYIERWKEAAPNSRIDNLYGPTEATLFCLIAPCGDEVPETPGRGYAAIGRPLPGTRVAIVDKERRFLPAGESGELALEGAQVTPGYWRAPDLTAARFPTLDHPEAGRGVWYLTGDLAREEPGGDFHYLGRLDNQVKIKGHRVELEEIEAHLRTASGGEVGAVAWPPQGAAQSLVAFVSGARVPAAEIPARMTDLVPAYMVPRRVIELARMPLTKNGKLDRKALLRILEEE